MTFAAEVPDQQEQPELDPRACRGPCNDKWRKDGKGSPRYGDPLLCSRCVSVLRTELAAIDTMAAVLVAEADGYRGSTGADSAIRAHRNAGSKGSPSPVHDLIDELTSDLRGWVVAKRKIADRLGQVARDVTELSSWLIANIDKYLYDPECAGPLSEAVHRWHGRLEKRAKAGTALVHKPIPCPSCRKMGLVQEKGAKTVSCTECGFIQAAEVYERNAADGAEAADAAKEAESAPAAKRRSRSAA